LTWRSGSWNPDRSIAFADLAPLWHVPNVRWIALQYDRRPDERHPQLIDDGPGELAALARFISHLDLVVTVDTMVAHLAGALNARVWTLLPRVADWRWMIDRPESPWYPSMRLFRQRTAGDWRTALADVADALRTDNSSCRREIGPARRAMSQTL
jgi:hypothetical protein